MAQLSIPPHLSDTSVVVDLSGIGDRDLEEIPKVINSLEAAGAYPHLICLAPGHSVGYLWGDTMRCA